MATARTQANSSNHLLRDVQTNWSWDSWDLEDARSKGKEHGGGSSSSGGHDENVDDDEDLAWRLQLEALQEVPGWGGRDGDDDDDAEFAMMQQLAEIEEAEEMRKKTVGLAGGGDGDDELALLMALEGVGGWWVDQHEEEVGVGREVSSSSSSAAKDADRRSNATTLCATTSDGTAQLAKDAASKGPPPPSSSSGSSTSQRIPVAPPTTTGTKSTAPPTVVCAVCNEPPSLSRTSSSSPQEVKRLAVLPCGHAYCAACLNNLFRAAINDPSLFPPRCCGLHIPLDCKDADEDGKEKRDKGGAQSKIGASRSSAGVGYRQWLEMETVAAFERRLNSAKGMVIAKSAEAEQSAATAGAVTSPEVDEEFLRMAEACGWARCCGCGRFVELEFGCNHMVCCCGAHFCYACGKPWKTCDCAQWDEDRLLKRAADLVAPTAGRPHEEAAPAAHNATPNQPQQTPQNTEPRHANRTDEASTNQRQQQQHQRQRRHQRGRQPVPPPPAPPNRDSTPTNPVPPQAPPPSYPLTTPLNHHRYNAIGNNNNNNADDADDPPPPYPGPPLPQPPPPMATSLLPDSPFHHQHHGAHLGGRPRPLTRTEYARLRASVRTVVDMLNAVLTAMDAEGGGGGGGGGRNGSAGGCYPFAEEAGPALAAGSSSARCCEHRRWAVVAAAAAGARRGTAAAAAGERARGRDDGGGCGNDAGLERCEVCAWSYGFDIWYPRGEEGGQGGGNGGGGGVMVCEGCGVRACWFCRENRL